MCNANNHHPNCTCGWGEGSNSSFSYSMAAFQESQKKIHLQKLEIDLSSYESYVNPNAKCPVCGETVYFYQSPYGGRVFFDRLGPPWPKHPCTDNGLLPGFNDEKSSHIPKWLKENWKPFVLDSYQTKGRNTQISGTIINKNNNTELKRWYLEGTYQLNYSNIYLIRRVDNDTYELSWFDLTTLKEHLVKCHRHYNFSVNKKSSEKSR